MRAFCRDCLADLAPCEAQCGVCKSARVLAHSELDRLWIAHLDCDAFYAAIEKRDDPSLRSRAVIIGGGRRGVVLTACYIARKSGVKSAMPMFQALKLCPHASIVPPNMSKYADVARQVRAKLLSVTPCVEAVSLDEAYLDLSGTERLHSMAPAKTMARLAQDIEEDIGITVSIGLSYNKLLAKLASDISKPRGFAVIGHGDARSFLRDKPVGILRGVGRVLEARLLKDNIVRVEQIQDCDIRALAERYGDMGLRLHRLANGEDDSAVEADGEAKSISAETTFEHDIRSHSDLERILWDQAERVSARAKASGLGGRTVVLKLKTTAFRVLTRSTTLDYPTQLAEVIFQVARVPLKKEANATPYRLLGVGLSQLCSASDCDPTGLLDTHATRRAAVEHAIDAVRKRFGNQAVGRGRGVF